MSEYENKYKNIINGKIYHVTDFNSELFVELQNTINLAEKPIKVNRLLLKKEYKKLRIKTDSRKKKILYNRDLNIVDKQNLNKRFTINYEESEKEIEKLIIENINKIEEGMKFIASQYKVFSGIIDVLARDKNGILCIIEIKVKSRCADIVFQAIYYPTQFYEKTRMICLSPSYEIPIYETLLKIPNIEIKSFHVDRNKNISFCDFKIMEGMKNEFSIYC